MPDQNYNSSYTGVQIDEGIAAARAARAASGLLKSDGSGNLSAAVPGTDYATPAQIPTVDSALSSSSENPVQNKKVKEALDTKGTYSKPSGGIPKTDLAPDVQASLGKADTALQGSNIATAVDAWLDDNVAQETGYVLDSSLTMSNAAAPADKVGELKRQINDLDTLGAMPTDEIKDALLTLAQNVAYSDESGQACYKQLLFALYPEVPTEYKRVEYISSNNLGGTPAANLLQYAPYIKTDFPSADTDIIGYTIELEYKKEFDYAVAPFGGRNAKTAGNTTIGTVYIHEKSNANSSLNFGNVTGQTKALVTYVGRPALNQKLKLKLASGVIYINDEMIADTEADTAVQSASYKWGLFGRNNGGSWATVSYGGGDLAPMIGRIYSFSIKDGNGDYVLKYIPCMRKADSAYGMYDTVSGKFYSSSGVNGFIGGFE